MSEYLIIRPFGTMDSVQCVQYAVHLLIFFFKYTHDIQSDTLGITKCILIVSEIRKEKPRCELIDWTKCTGLEVNHKQ